MVEIGGKPILWHIMKIFETNGLPPGLATIEASLDKVGGPGGPLCRMGLPNDARLRAEKPACGGKSVTC
jgi:hypothetical protein